MKRSVLFLSLSVALSSCSSAPPVVSTKLEHEQVLGHELTLGTRDGDIVVQRKINMAEKIRSLQVAVYSLEADVYGSEFGSPGLYGVLRNCKFEESKATDGEFHFEEPRDLVTRDEPVQRIGYDERDILVGMSEEKLQARLDRFNEYQAILKQRESRLQMLVDRCKVKQARREIASHE